MPGWVGAGGEDAEVRQEDSLLGAGWASGSSRTLIIALYIPVAVVLVSSFLCCSVEMPLSQLVSFIFFFWFFRWGRGRVREQPCRSYQLGINHTTMKAQRLWGFFSTMQIVHLLFNRHNWPWLRWNTNEQGCRLDQILLSHRNTLSMKKVYALCSWWALFFSCTETLHQLKTYLSMFRTYNFIWGHKQHL